MTTPTDDILTAARKRLDAITAERAALDAEEQKLRRMIAAAEGQPEPAKVGPPVEIAVRPETLEEAIRRLMPAPSPSYPWPVVPIQPHPMTPWQPVTPWSRPEHGGLCACPQCCPPTYCGTVTIASTGGMLVNGPRGGANEVLYVGSPLLVDEHARGIGAMDVMGSSLDEAIDWRRSNGVRLDNSLRVGDTFGCIDSDQRYTVS